MPKFKLGNIVFLKSNPDVLMTIRTIVKSNEFISYNCIWFDNCSTIVTGTFEEHTLGVL